MAPVVQLFGQPPGTTTVLQRNPLQQMEVPRLRERARTLARLEGFYVFERVVTLSGEPGVAAGATVTPGLLRMMAAPISQGRSFTAGEEEPGHFVALITDRYWRETLGSGSVLGTSLIIDDQPHTIVGILSPALPCRSSTRTSSHDQPTCGGRQHPAPGANEDGRAELFLNLTQLMTDGGLGDVEPIGGARDAFRAGDLHNQAEVTGIKECAHEGTLF